MATSKNQYRPLAELPRPIQQAVYEREAQAYIRSLPPEHYMESTAQATQRAITLASLALLKVHRPDVQVFSELLVQYPIAGRRKLGQVVPDNMIVLTDEPIEAMNSFNLTLEPQGPFLALEYVSPSNPRKDYEDSFRKYERGLKVPYYLVFRPDDQDLRLFKNNRGRFTRLQPDERNRYAIPELDLEVGLLDGWVRYWYRGVLLPLPEELQQQLHEALRTAEVEKRRADDETRRADEEKLRADDEKRRADELTRRLQALEAELAAVRGHRKTN